MNIAGVLVHARADSSEQVAASLGRMPGLEIHARTEDHRFVVTIEEQENSVISETLLKLHTVDGVLSAAMVYQHAEPEENTATIDYPA
ncbi:MAG: chaperone NapD [Desulfobulbaceae bacterium]|nr:chaperone NapD [Desulfobulbaceae bacterium]HIJ89525.1 chaperone NapD [Deltaproteobacteria bacterium]